MTESIQGIIDQISKKTKILHEKLVNERYKNAVLVSEINHLQDKLKIKSNELKETEAKLLDQEERLHLLMKQNSVSVAEPSMAKAQEIDELVKEIEYCIGQLRK